MSKLKNNLNINDLPPIPSITDQLDLRPVINVAVFGCVSVGKSTFLNMMMARMFSDCHIKRTTIMPQIYYELTEYEQDKIDKKEDIDRKLSDLERIRSINSDINSNQMKEQATSGIAIKLKDIKPSRYVVPAIKGFAKLQSDSYGHGVTLAIHDMPGLNDSISRDAYFEYVKQNFSEYDIAILILDINSSLNTSDEVDILDLLLNGINANKLKGVDTKLLVLMNKCDSLNITNKGDPVPEDKELQEMLDQAMDVVAVRFTELKVEISNCYFSCISCEDSFVYRMIKYKRFDELDIKYINRIGQLEFPARQWKNFSEANKRKKVMELITEEGVEEGLKMSGFYAFKKKFEKIIDMETQYSLCFNRINKKLLTRQRPRQRPLDMLDITVDLKWFHRIKVVIHNTNRIFKKELSDNFDYFDTEFEKFLECYFTYIEIKLKSVHFLEVLQSLKKNLVAWETKLNLEKYECVSLIFKCIANRMKELGIQELRRTDHTFSELLKTITILVENKIDAKREIQDMMSNIYKYQSEKVGKSGVAMKPTKKATIAYQKAATRGNAQAQFNLGSCYEDGEGVTKNPTKAFEWYQKAADQGDAIAQIRIGVCYEYGEGVAKNPTKAFEWYQKAADQGYAIAQRNLGWCYEEGQGVAQSYEKACEWYQKAADQGDAIAQESLEEYYISEQCISVISKKQVDNKSQLYHFIMAIPEETGVTIDDRYKALARASINHITETFSDLQKLALARVVASYQVKSTHRYWGVLQLFKTIVPHYSFDKKYDWCVINELDHDVDITSNMKEVEEGLPGLFMKEVFK